MPTPPLSGISLLPALSVVLGLPLCHGNRTTNDGPARAIGVGSTRAVNDDHGSGNGDGNNHGRGPSSSSDREASSESAGSLQSASSRGKQQHREDFARRAKNNASRIYARRVINRARLERQHPWATAAATKDPPDGGERGNDVRRQGGRSPPGDERFQKWKDDLLSETLLSLIKLQEEVRKVKSLTSSNLGRRNEDANILLSSDGNNSLLSQLGILPSSINSNVACCESITSKQRTLDDYNALSAVATARDGGADDDKLKPAEWSDDVDLVQRRLEFGKEISPLSDTTRLQRLGMACRRIIALGMLAAPLGVMVPCNVVLGNLAGGESSAEEEGGGDGEDDGAAKGSSRPSALQRYRNGLKKFTWDYALWAVETAGPTYIKLVQWASTRNDLFSPEFVGHFSKLQDETRGHSWRETESTLERAFGEDWRSLLSFDEVISDGDDESDGVEGGRLKRTGGTANRERQKRLMERNEAKSSPLSPSSPTVPIGSGCVAQVYKARLTCSHGLHPAGTPVAVKVQHPRILEKVCLDFYIMNKLASLLEHIPRLNLDYLSVKDSVDQFRDIMLPQLDLRVEAHNLTRFRRCFEGEARIAFPEPLSGLTSREVLVERFVEGEPMLNFVSREDEHHSKKDREELATIGLKTVMEMIFLHDFVHADLHPGNMIVDRNKSVRGQPLRVHMIDCGLTVELGERDHMNLVKILGSLIKRDGYAAGKLMVDTAKKCQATELDVEMFCRGIEKICLDDEENNFLESVGDYITDICYLACKHKVKLEAAFINAALACEIMEGLASSLYPDMKVQSVALPMVLKAEMMHGLKGLPNPRLWSLK